LRNKEEYNEKDYPAALDGGAFCLILLGTGCLNPIQDNDSVPSSGMGKVQVDLGGNAGPLCPRQINFTMPLPLVPALKPKKQR
jgi:hypothetical protein